MEDRSTAEDRSRPSRCAIYFHCFSEKSSGVLVVTSPTLRDGTPVLRVSLTHYAETGDESLRTLEYDASPAASNNLDGAAMCVEGALRRYEGTSAAVMYLLDEEGEQTHDMCRWSLDRREWDECERSVTMLEKMKTILKALLVV